MSEKSKHRLTIVQRSHRVSNPPLRLCRDVKINPTASTFVVIVNKFKRPLRQFILRHVLLRVDDTAKHHDTVVPDVRHGMILTRIHLRRQVLNLFPYSLDGWQSLGPDPSVVLQSSTIAEGASAATEKKNAAFVIESRHLVIASRGRSTFQASRHVGPAVTTVVRPGSAVQQLVAARRL